MRYQDVSARGYVRLMFLLLGLMIHIPVAAEEAPSMELLEFLVDLEEVDDQGLVHPMAIIDQPVVAAENADRGPEHRQ